MKKFFSTKSLLTKLSFLFLGLLLLLILLVVGILSPVGTRLVINQVNDANIGASITYEEGSLLTSLALRDVIYEQKGLKAELSEVELDIGWSCFFEMSVCVDSLALDSAKVVLSQTETAPKQDTPISSYIELPLPVSMKALRLNRLEVYEENQRLLSLESVSLNLGFYQKLNIDDFKIGGGRFYLTPNTEEEASSSKLDTPNERKWIDQIAEFKYKPVNIPELFIPINASLESASISNFCLENSQAESSSSMLCFDSLNTSFDLNEQKMTLNLALANFSDKRDTPVFNNIDGQLNVVMDFENNFKHDISLSVFPNKGGVSNLPSNPPIKKSPLLDTPINDDSKLYVSMKGNATSNQLGVFVGAHDEPALNIKLLTKPQLNDLPLSIDMQYKDEGKKIAAFIKSLGVKIEKEVLDTLIGVSHLNAKVDGDMNEYALTIDYQAESDRRATFGVNNASLDMSLMPHSHAELMEIHKLNISGDIGEVNYEGLLSLNDDVSGRYLELDASLALDKIGVSKLNEQLSGELTGVVPHSFSISKSSQWGSVANARLSGDWFDLPLKLAINSHLERDGTIVVEELALQQSSSNVIKVNGALLSTQALSAINAAMGTQLDGKNKTELKFDINIEDAALLYPEIAGSLLLKGEISGPIEEPKINFVGSGEGIQYEQNNVASLSLSGSVDIAKKLSSTLKLSASNIATPQATLPKLELILDGNSEKQAFTLSIPQGNYQTKQVLLGQLEQNDGKTTWNGRWEEGSVITDLAELHLQSKPEMTIELSPFAFSIDKHCWRGRSDHMCFSGVNVSDTLANAKLDFSYNATTLLSQLISSLDKSRSNLDFEGQANLAWNKSGGASFESEISANDTRFLVDEKVLDIQAIELKLNGDANNVQSQLNLTSVQNGNVELTSELQKRDSIYWHKGQIGVSQFRLNEFKVLLEPVQKLEGMMQAKIDFEGPLAKPKLFGFLALEQVSLGLQDVPMLLTDYHQRIEFDAYDASFDGRFLLQEKLASRSQDSNLPENKQSGQGLVNGSANFENDLLLNASISGTELGIEYETYRFRISPDLKIALTPELFDLQGAIAIPYARIKLKTLPDSAKSESADIVVIDEDKKQSASVIPLNINLDIKVDEQEKGEVRIDALDLNAQLHGNLNLQIDESNTRLNGLVKILKGDYEAYSQVLQIRKGDITFSGQPEVPTFDIEAIRNPLNTADDVIAGIQVRGNALQPKVDLFSEPSMEQARQLSYLIAGTDIGSGGGDGADSNTVLVNALVSYGVGKSENGLGGLGRSFGVEDLNLSTAGQGTDTQVQLSGQLAQGVRVTYGVGVFESISEVTVQYQLLPKLYLEAVSGASNTLDLYYQVTSKD